MPAEHNGVELANRIETWVATVVSLGTILVVPGVIIAWAQGDFLGIDLIEYREQPRLVLMGSRMLLDLVLVVATHFYLWLATILLAASIAGFFWWYGRKRRRPSDWRVVTPLVIAVLLDMMVFDAPTHFLRDLAQTNIYADDGEISAPAVGPDAIRPIYQRLWLWTVCARTACVGEPKSDNLRGLNIWLGTNFLLAVIWFIIASVLLIGDRRIYWSKYVFPTIVLTNVLLLAYSFGKLHEPDRYDYASVTVKQGERAVDLLGLIVGQTGEKMLFYHTSGSADLAPGFHHILRADVTSHEHLEEKSLLTFAFQEMTTHQGN